MGTMKKWVVTLGAALVLMGCNGTTETEEEPPTVEEDPGSDTDTDVDVDEEIDDETDDDANLGGRGNDTEEDPDTEVGEEEMITFVPQKADIESSLTIENDEVLSTLNELVETATIDEVGIPDDVTIQFTGLYLDNADEQLLMPIFLISNRTDESFTNVEMAISFGSTDGEMLFENTGFTLDEEQFGVLEPNTAMPVYLNTDYSNLELVERLSQTREESITVESFNPGNAEDQSNSGNELSNTTSLAFVPTASQDAEGITVDNHIVLSQVQELINNSPEVGAEGDVVMHWTGIYEETAGAVNGQAVFIIVNRTGHDMKNLELGINFADSNNNVILAGERSVYTEEEFGIFKDQTIKPLYVDIPEDKAQLMQNVLDVNQATYNFDYFDAEQVN